MKKVFISQQKTGKMSREKMTEQGKILAHVNEILGEPVMLIDNYMREHYSQTPLECLGENLKRMAHADCVAFVAGWQKARCRVIERMCAEQYGLEIFEI